MRFALACTLALLMAPPFASSSDMEPRDALVVTVLGAEDFGAIVTWSPAPNAVGYAVFRGPTPEESVYVGRVTGLVFHDAEPLEGASWYTIVSLDALRDDWTEITEGASYKGSCVHQRGTTGITVTASQCMPPDPDR